METHPSAQTLLPPCGQSWEPDGLRGRNGHARARLLGKGSVCSFAQVSLRLILKNFKYAKVLKEFYGDFCS